MSLLCSLTGQVAVHPVLNPKSGRVYERHVIEQHLLTSSTDPNTQEPLSSSDLVPIQPSSLSLPPFLSSPSPATASLSSLLSSLQREFDGVLLEQFALKRDVHSLKQELAHALYQYDAACRVIARLVKERDEAKEALRSVSLASPPAPVPVEAKQPPSASMEVDSDRKEGGAASMTAAFEATSERLGGKKRKAALKEKAAVAARKEEVAAFTSTQSFTLHGASTPGVTAVDVDERPQGERLLLTGGADGGLLLFDVRVGQVRQALKGHKKRVTGVVFVRPASSPPPPSPLPLLSSSADHSVHLYTADGVGAQYALSSTWADHTAAVTSLSLHPSALYFASSSLDSSYHLYSLTSPAPVVVTTTPSPLNSVAFHPDGRILASCHADCGVRIYDALSSQCIVAFTSHTAATVGMAFSPNGYQAASGDAGGVVRVWDLRKVDGEKESNIATIQLAGAGGAGIGPLQFDEAGGLLGVGVGSEVVVAESKGWTEVVRWKEHKDEVKDLRWGSNGQWLVTASKDRTVKLWGKPQPAA